MPRVRSLPSVGLTLLVPLCLLLGLLLLGPSDLRASWFADPVISDAPQPLHHVALADLDLDGSIDLIASPLDSPWLYHVFHGDIVGRMDLVQSLPGAAHAGTDVAILRVDGDEYPDLVAVGGWPPLKIWYNDGTGQFAAGEDEDRIWEPLVVTDVDGDGFDDLAGMAGEEAVGIFYGSAAGLDLSNLQFIGLADFPETMYVSLFDVFDLDGDGAADIVAVGSRTPDPPEDTAAMPVIRWVSGSGARAFASEPRSFYNGEPFHGFGSLDWADLDHDGDQDLLCFSNTAVSSSLFYFDDVTETFLPGGRPLDDVDRKGRFARIDDDAEWDVVAIQCDGGSKVYRGLGDGAFEFVEDLPGATFGIFAPVFGEDAPAFVSVGFDDPSGLPLAVWRDLTFDPSSVPFPLGSSGFEVRAEPSVASSQVRISWSSSPDGSRMGTPNGVSNGSWEQEAQIRILDIRGRTVLRSRLRGGQAVWDLRNGIQNGTALSPSAGAGIGVGSGIYFVQVEEDGRRSQPIKVVVVR